MMNRSIFEHSSTFFEEHSPQNMKYLFILNNQLPKVGGKTDNGRLEAYLEPLGIRHQCRKKKLIPRKGTNLIQKRKAFQPSGRSGIHHGSPYLDQLIHPGIDDIIGFQSLIQREQLIIE